MANPVKIPVTKSTDRDYYEALRKISNTDPGPDFQFAKLTFSAQGIQALTYESFALADADENLIKILNGGGRVFRTISITNPNSANITFTRSDDFAAGKDNGLEDVVSLSLGNHPTEPQTKSFPLLIATTQNACGSFSVSNLAGWLGEQANQHFTARDEALTRLETAIANSLREYEDLRKKHFSDLEQKNTKLDAASQEHREQLDHQHTERMKLLDDRQLELDEQRQKLDDRSSTHVRRELREKLKEILKSRQESFALSSDTTKRRRHVVWLYILALCAFGSLATVSIVQEFRSTGIDYWLLGRLIASSVGFFVFLGFFIRWLSSWAHQNAEEEFKLKQLDIDIDRASWLVEMAFEWDEAKDNPLPAHLVETLSANLFGHKSKAEVSTSPTDAIAKLLSGLPSGAAEIDFPGGKLTLDRKALAKASKKSKQD